MAPKFTEEQLQRYSRHIILPQVGGKGQRRLLESRVFVVGAGGLGSPVLLYLAAAGVGTIEIIDADRVDASNLQRQIVHTTARLGMDKTESARRAIAGINPDVRVMAHQELLTKANVLERFAAADVIVDGSDNFPTRYLVNDAAYRLRKPLVSGAMYRFEGQVTVFPNDGGAESPCYRCLFAEPPPPGTVPTCQEAGIFGCVPGVIGSIQATETIKLLLGIGETLAGRLLLYDALAMTWRELKLRRDPECALNGDRPTLTELIEYAQNPCDLKG
ncbi:molybdopterin-synthase adenylyltransferase MoeB [Candidatus Poribacteria bacterium]|nr:molybdopterin-synthase adenylyltransferase MoeB [Candidatus Poribacteria bacterium]